MKNKYAALEKVEELRQKVQDRLAYQDMGERLHEIVDALYSEELITEEERKWAKEHLDWTIIIL